MAAEQRKATGTETAATRSLAFGVSALDAPAGSVDEAMTSRPAGLDVQAQSALLHEAFEAPGPLELDELAFAPSPQRSFMARYGRRAIKSALGLGVVIIAGVGPVQRLLEFSSVEAVVNARLVSLRAGLIEHGLMLRPRARVLGPGPPLRHKALRVGVPQHPGRMIGQLDQPHTPAPHAPFGWLVTGS